MALIFVLQFLGVVYAYLFVVVPLLEGLVFAKRAAADIMTVPEFKKTEDFDNLVNLDDYEDLQEIMEKYHKMVVKEIKEEARLRALKEEAV